MADHETKHPDFGSGEKTLGIYTFGIISCAILTLLAFWAVMSSGYDKMTTFTIIYVAACVQFLVQVICFLRLNMRTEQSRMNVMSLIFTGVILVCVIVGSLWIMANLNYYMAH